ncbi:MAG: FmdB family zinc ribbon protein [Burkholderiaceae bacterium]|jgi:putative FmdB family regulatory protein
MPIYAYKCGSCGHSKDVLQKISDAPLTECPACGRASFAKQLTAAGFQLKGSGWYVTDFRGGNTAAGAAAGTASGAAAGASTAASGGDAKPAEGGGAGASDSGKTESATASAGAAGCGGSCACH